MPDDSCVKIYDFIKSIPKMISQYTGVPKRYLNSDLKIKILNEIFLKKYPESNVKYEFFRTDQTSFGRL